MYVCMCMWGKMADGPGGLASTVIYFVALLLRGWRKFRRVFPDNMGSDTIQTAIKEALRTEKIRETKTQWKLKFTRWRMSTRCSAITLNVLTSPASVTGLDKWKTEWSTEWSTTSSRNVNKGIVPVVGDNIWAGNRQIEKWYCPTAPQWWRTNTTYSKTGCTWRNANAEKQQENFAGFRTDNNYRIIKTSKVIVQELCESRGGRPGLSVLTSLLVSVGRKELLNRAPALVTTCP